MSIRSVRSTISPAWPIFATRCLAVETRPMIQRRGSWPSIDFTPQPCGARGGGPFSLEPRGAGHEEAEMGIETAVGKSATIEFNGQLCIHARRCVLSQPTVFKANVEGPWIDPDAASAEALMYVALNCPSEAIRVSRHDGGANEISPMVNTILVRENGPLAINAEMVVAGAPIG